ncbi:MAG: glucose-1-phosphate adenylyltransferase, partial [Oscillospiraceae bacterium]
PNARIEHSLVTGGCEVCGDVENSVLFHSVTVEEGACVRYSILMPGTTVKAGAVIEYSIVAENAVIGENARVGTPPNSMNPDWGISVIAGDVKVGQGAVVPAHAMVTKNVKGAVQK